MEQYRHRMVEMVTDLTALIDAVIEVLDDRPQEDILIALYESPSKRLRRKLSYPPKPAPVRKERAALFSSLGSPVALVGRSSISGLGVIITQASAHAGTFTVLTPEHYVEDVITERRWIGLSDAEQVFAENYRAIAELLPEQHPLREHAIRLQEAFND